MNPEKNVIALKARVAGSEGDSLQLFDMGAKTKLKSVQFAHPVVFWRWTSPSQLGLVTATSVYHWNVDAEPEPVKAFDRTANLEGTQIISYRVDATGAWSALVGIAPGSPERPHLVKGHMQLHSAEHGRSQSLEAHAACFATVQPAGRTTPANVIAFASKTAAASRLHVVEVGAAPGQGLKRSAELFFPAEFADDFPVSLQIGEKHGLAYVVTKLGLLFVYDLESAAPIYRTRMSPDPVFLAAPASRVSGGDGFAAVSRRGAVLLGDVDPAALVPFVADVLGNAELALALAARGDLPGAEPLAERRFRELLAAGESREAAELAARAPRGCLRTAQAIESLKRAPAAAGQTSPLLVYFGTLLSRGKLNALESVELGRLVIAQGKKQLLDGWWREGKLEASEDLGDAFRRAGDWDLAEAVWRAAGPAAAPRVVEALAAKGDFEALGAYAREGAGPGAQPDYLFLLQKLLVDSPEAAVGLAKAVARMPGPPVAVNVMADLFLQRNAVKEATEFLLDALSKDDPADALLQTKLLEVNLVADPQVADAILASGQLTHYDRPRIAQLCEKSGLYLRALQHYTDLADIRRVVVNTHALDPAALVEFFGTLSAEWALDCLGVLLDANPTANLQLVVQIAKQYADQLEVSRVVELFEKRNSWGGLYLFLGSLIATSDDPEIHYKYIEAAAKTGQIAEVERETRESEAYPADRVRAFLEEANLPDARPLINVCDRHDMVPQLTAYLWKRGMLRYIEGYVQKVSPQKAPLVVGALLDAEADEKFVVNLLLSVRSLVPVDALVDEVEQRNKLRILDSFLEQLVSEGSRDPQVHNALGKIVVDANNNPEHFLTTNPYYDSAVVGRFAEKRDPALACVAYRRGQCDDLLVDCTNRHAMFKLQARYVVGRQDADLWNKVLADENRYRRQLVDQVVSTALPECSNPEQVSVAVKAFMQAGLQAELIELLEKIVLDNSSFSNNHNLQNLLIITAIKADPSRVKDYVHRLDNFDGPAVGEIAVGYELFEEAFEIYKKFNLKDQAVKVLLEHLGDLDRAHEYASKVDVPSVWSELAGAYLAAGLVSDAVDASLRADDASRWKDVLAAAAAADDWSAVPKYLQMARKKLKDPQVDAELVHAYAKVGDLGSLEEMLAGQHQADLQACGDRLFDQGLFEGARAVYARIPNYGRLASTLVRLHEFQGAVDAARRADAPKTWREVCRACVEEKEWRLAQLCGLHVIVNADDLADLSRFYRDRGAYDELIALLESGIGLERAHAGVFTELGALYARHRPEKLMEHLKLFSARINVPQLIRVCEELELWKELVFLYVQYDEHDNALQVMAAHSPSAWDHATFKDVAAKAKAGESLYRAVTFYLEEHPDLLTDLLKVVEGRLDHGRVVEIVRRAHQLPLVKSYLLSVQKNNLQAVNDAVNELLIDEEDAPALRESITSFDNFDQLSLASKLETHSLLEFRRLAALLYKRNLKWSKAVALAKEDGLDRDALETAAQSGEPALAEEVLRHFVKTGQKEYFGAALYACYGLIKPDVALEVAWGANLIDVAMPFMIQSLRDLSSKVDGLVAERDEARAKSKEEAETKKQQEQAANAYLHLNSYLALPAPQGAPLQGAPGINGGLPASF